MGGFEKAATKATLADAFHGNLNTAIEKHPAGLEMGRVKTAFSCDWHEVNHAFRSVFSCFYVMLSMKVNSIVI